MLERDIACAACGYNLRGLGRQGVCPECGRDIASSLAQRQLSPKLLTRLSVGALLIGFGTSIYACCVAAAFLGVSFRIILFSLPIGAAFSSIGSWRFAEVSSNRQAWMAVLVRAGAIAISILQTAFGIAIALLVHGAIGFNALLPAFIIMMLGWAYCVSLTCLRASMLASEIHDRLLEIQARILALLGTLVLLIGIEIPWLIGLRGTTRFMWVVATLVSIGWGAAFFLWFFVALRSRARLLNVSSET